MNRRTAPAYLALALVALAACSREAPPAPPAPGPVVDLKKQLDDEFQAKLRAEGSRIAAIPEQTPEAIAARAETEEKYRARLMVRIPDPGSAQLRNVRMSAGALCGEVSVKQSGGMAPFAGFVVDAEDIRIQVDRESDADAHSLWFGAARKYGCL